MERLVSPELYNEEINSSDLETLAKKCKIESCSISVHPLKIQRDKEIKGGARLEINGSEKKGKQPRPGLHGLKKGV